MDELEIVQYKQTSGLNVFLNNMEYRSAHFHQDWELLWLLDAPLTINCMHRVQTIQPGDVVIFPPNCTHELIKARKSCVFLCLQISSKLFPSTANLTLEDIRIREYLTPEEFNGVRQTMLDIASAYLHREEQYELLCYGHAALLLHTLIGRLPFRRISAEEAASITQQNARLLRLVDFVGSNYSHKILLSDFAEQEGCSISYLSHFIRDTMNQTFQEYVDSVRFSEACRMISEGQDSMLSICNAAGFSDYRYFSRAFRKAFGMTPAQYRKQEHITVPEPDIQSHSFQSQEKLLTRSQSLFLLQKFHECLA